MAYRLESQWPARVPGQACEPMSQNRDMGHPTSGWSDLGHPPNDDAVVMDGVTRTL